jgi:hypothetical protein
MMDVLQKTGGRWVIIHGGREIAEDFEAEAGAWSWADKFVDDQITCGPNWLAPPLRYRTPEDVGHS